MEEQTTNIGSWPTSTTTGTGVYSQKAATPNIWYDTIETVSAKQLFDYYTSDRVDKRNKKIVVELLDSGDLADKIIAEEIVKAFFNESNI